MRLQKLRFILLGTAIAMSPAPVLAEEDGDGWIVRLGGGPALEPAYPGADWSTSPFSRFSERAAPAKRPVRSPRRRI